MKITARLVWPHTVLAFMFAVVGCVSLCTTHSEAQTGNNAVYNSTGNCSPSSPCASSPAFIDTTVFASSTYPDICTLLHHVLVSIVQTTYPYGAVIDARGLPAAGTSMTCPSTQPSPWYGITNPPPSTILLPATSATTPSAPISIPSTWVLPPNTHLIGEGDSVSSSGTIHITIQAQSSFSGSMIQFGSSSCGASTCTGVSVENLTLDGQGF